jgi:hypothetical protein
VCGVPGIGRAVITEESSHKNWNEENLENLGTMNLKGRLFKMFQHKRDKIKVKNQEFESNSSQFKIRGDTLTPQKIKVKPTQISAFCTQDPRNLDIRQTKSLAFKKFTKETEYPEMAS